MAPGITEGTSWRALASVAIPLLLVALLILYRSPSGRVFTGTEFHAQPAALAQRSFSSKLDLHEGEELRGYVERAKSHLDDPQAMYYVAQALEECSTWGTTDDDLPPGHTADLKQWMRYASAQDLAAPCRGIDGLVIDSRQILALLHEAARQGEPHARARMLLFRDIAAPKSDAIAEIPGLLATGDPAVVRDVGAFLAKGEVSLRLGRVIVDARTAAIAWELAACDLGYPCGPFSRLLLWQCAFKGYCDAYRYDEAIARDEDPQRMALAQQLRGGLVYALRRQDWTWLGLGEDAAVVR
jgi:hypothetical protein